MDTMVTMDTPHTPLLVQINQRLGGVSSMCKVAISATWMKSLYRFLPQPIAKGEINYKTAPACFEWNMLST